MIGYKGFNPDFTCNGKQYEENTVFEEERAEICSCGMHFCENPFDVLNYYDLVNEKGQINEFAEVEALDEALTNGNEKFCTKKLKIGAKLGLKGFVKACFDFNYEKIKKEVEENVSDRESGGDRAKLAGGDWAKLAGGNNALLIGGNGSFAKAKKGSVITLVNCDIYGNITEFKAEQVDGERIKEDTFYKLVNGEFEEV